MANYRECPICKNRFTHGSSLFRHMRAVHGINPKYQCPTCGKPFLSVPQLGGHQTSAHTNHNTLVSRTYHWSQKRDEWNAFRKRMSEERVLGGNPSWKGGSSKHTLRRLAFEVWRQKRECYFCGRTDTLDVHHKDWDKTRNVPENIIVLCRSCHASIHRGGQMAVMGMALRYSPSKDIELLLGLIPYKSYRLIRLLETRRYSTSRWTKTIVSSPTGYPSRTAITSRPRASGR